MNMWQCERAVYCVCVNVFALAAVSLHYAQLWVGTPTPRAHYDYIIVGGGTAGSLIAHRLATETKHSYVVLEAGGRHNFLTNIPVLGPLLQGSVYDWAYKTVPQQNACLSMKDNRCKWPSGKILGGSAILNNMIHLRGNLTHYVDWFHGRYSAADIEEQFSFIERNILPVNDMQHQSRLSDAILEAASEMGYRLFDLNHEFSLGFMKSPLNQRHGGRWSTSHTLLENKNEILYNIHVDKILVNTKNVAYGIEYSKNGEPYRIRANKGVILSAGTINTPKLLLLSGVGPEHHLNEMGIKVVQDLPVGKNLQDHVGTGFDLVLFDQSLKYATWDMLNPFHAWDYFVAGKGPFTSPGCEVVGVLSTDNTSADLQFMVLPVGITSDRGVHLKHNIGLEDEVWDGYFANLFDKYTATILPILLHPRSKGDVRLTSKDPKDPPLVDPKYLTDNEDVDVLVRGLEILRKFVETAAMKRIGAYMNSQPYPGCEIYDTFSEDYWRCYVKRLTLTTFHPVGTCKMGLADSRSSVVDTDFKVIGVNRLFVADGSVLPTLPSANVNAAIALMANIFFNVHFVKSPDTILQRGVCKKLDRICDHDYNICLQPVKVF